MNAARAHQIFARVTISLVTNILTIPTQRIFALHMAIIVNFQSSPPIMMPLTGYARPLRTMEAIKQKVEREQSFLAIAAQCNTNLVLPRQQGKLQLRHRERQDLLSSPSESTSAASKSLTTRHWQPHLQLQWKG